MADKVFSATHTRQDGALREVIIHIDICRRSDIRDHTGESVPYNIEYGMYLGAHICSGLFSVLFCTHFEVREHLKSVKHTVIAILIKMLQILCVICVLPVFSRNGRLSQLLPS